MSLFAENERPPDSTTAAIRDAQQSAVYTEFPIVRAISQSVVCTIGISAIFCPTDNQDSNAYCVAVGSLNVPWRDVQNNIHAAPRKTLPRKYTDARTSKKNSQPVTLQQLSSRSQKKGREKHAVRRC